jgi:DNA adenine methylase
MQYLGGKSKFGHVIVRECERWRKPGLPFVDVFMGALNVVRHAKAPRYAFDVNQALVTTFARVIDGTWDPPRALSEQEYARIKANPDPHDPLTAFAMIGCSFGAMWGSAFAKSNAGSSEPSEYPRRARNGLLEKAAACRDLTVACSDYRNLPTFPSGSVFYLDPPYEGTAGYDGAPPFSHGEFWKTATQWANDGKLVFVSEGNIARMRPGWVVYREWWTKQVMQGTNKGGQRVERLIVHESSPMAQDKTAFFRLARGR